MKKITIVSALALCISGLTAQMGAKIDQFYMDYSLRFPGGSLEYVLLHILVPNEGIVEIPKNMIFKLEVIG